MHPHLPYVFTEECIGGLQRNGSLTLLSTNLMSQHFEQAHHCGIQTPKGQHYVLSSTTWLLSSPAPNISAVLDTLPKVNYYQFAKDFETVIYYSHRKPGNTQKQRRNAAAFNP